MAVIWAEGFDTYGTSVTFLSQNGYSNVSNFSNNLKVDATNPRTGTHCLRITNYNFCGIRRTLNASISTCISGFGVCINSAINSNNMGIRFFNGATLLGRIGFNSNLGINVYNAAGTLVGASANNLFTLGSYQNVQVKIVRHATLGSIEVRVSGNPVVIVNGINTGASDINNVELGSIVSDGTGACSFDFDDWWICDTLGGVNNDFLGDRRCATSFPNADVTADWTPSSGTVDYDMVNDNPPVDTNYIEAGVAGNIFEATKPPIGFQSNDVAAVVVQARVMKTDAGTSTVRLGVHSGAFVSNSAEIVPGTTFAYAQQIFDLDPNGNIPWTRTNVDAMTPRLTRQQ